MVDYVGCVLSHLCDRRCVVRRGEFLELALDNALLKLDDEARVPELLEYAKTVYDSGALYAIRDLMTDGALPDIWVSCDILEEEEFWEAVRGHLEKRDEQDG